MKSSNRQRLFSSAPAAPWRLGLFAAAALALMVLDHRQGHLQNVHKALSVIVYPVETAAALPNRIIRWGSEELASRERLIAEVNDLRRENLQDAARLERYDALKQENDRLRALMDAAAQAEGHVLVAELVGIDLDPFRQQILLNKGSHDGVQVGQPLMDARGIMGQITHVGPMTARAILITDPNHAIPVEINRTGLHTLAVGTGDSSRLDLPYLPNNADVKVGDLLVSSGLGGRFPRGFPVGTVTRIQPNPGEPFMSISARPAAALERSHEVLLLSPNQRPVTPEPKTAAEKAGG